MLQECKLRTGFVFLLFCALYGLILFSLYSIQIRQRQFFTDLGSRQYHVNITSMPPRAEIYDRHGKNLAINKDQLSAFILPKTLKNPQQTKKFLKKNFPQSFERLTKAEAQKNLPHFLFIKRKLNPEQLALIKDSGLEDVQLLAEPSRFYPLPSAASIIGLTDIDNRGLFGIELMFNKQLSGTASTYRIEKDARSGHCYFAKETKVVGSDAIPINLTIDSDLQFLAYEELKHTIDKFGAREGGVLVMDPATGEIIVMAQCPTVDTEQTQQVDQHLAKNRIVTDVHEPGSIMKVFLALAALEEGVVTPDDLIDCENTKFGNINGFKFGTVHANGVIPFSEVIADSNNIGVAKVALRLGPKLYDHYRKVGFGTKTGLNWPGEQAGFVNPPQRWSRSSILVMSFGYEVTASLLQLATAFSVIANNGRLVQPKIIKEQGVKISEPLYSDETIAEMRDILSLTVDHGTGKNAAINGYKILGKTGTANLVVNGKYSLHNNIYSFVGIVEKGDYKRIIVTFLKDLGKKGVYAGTTAAPLFNKIAEKVLIHDQVI